MGQDDSQTLDGWLGMRVDKAELDKFKAKSRDMGKPYQLLIREIITALNDGNLRIILNEDQKSKVGELYNVN